MHKTTKNSRRHFLTQSATAAFAVGGGLVLTPSASAEKLNPDDALAKSLNYTHASATAGQSCGTCQFYTGSAGAGWGDCAIFPGKQVNAKGWCKSWINKA